MLEDLGNIGEFVGSFAVLITLVYLAVQIRHNTNSNIGATEMAVADQVIAWQMGMTDDAELRTIWDKAAATAQLTGAEEARFLWLINEVFTLHECTFRQYRRKLISYNNWEVYLHALLGLLRMNDAVMGWWTSRMSIFLSDFIDHIDEQLVVNKERFWTAVKIEST